MIKDKTIIIDLDSTILDTSFTIVNLYNKLNPDNQLSYTHNHSWGFEPIINTKEELSDLFKLFDHEDFYKDVIVFPNAIKIINELAENNRVYIVSKHCETRKRLSREWINKVMPKVEIAFVDNFKDKGKLFDKVDYVIDDRIDTLDSFSEGTTCILYSEYQWNKDCDDYHRCMNWNDIKEYIETRENIKGYRNYYKNNPLQFVEDCLGTSIKLKWHQRFFIKHINKISFRMGRR
jgi:5'(3')-deoxyribonucleotidase